jgi:dTDP-4-amino-4,6-dideoxygalactose transaminase
MDNLRVSTGTFTVTSRMRELVDEVLTSGIISYGEKSRMYERGFAKIHNCKYAVLSNSGTSSLLIALQALKEIHLWNDGDEVIVPATTFVATSNIVMHNRMIPVFVDIEAKTYGIDPKRIEEKITEKTRAIIPVHLFGQPCNMTEVRKIAKKYRLKIIEDSCECMFVTHRGEMVGSLGDIGCFSSYVAHLVVTGVGGISTTNTPEYAAKMRSLVNHGLNLPNLNLDKYASPQPMVGRKFLFDSIGHSFRITEFEAALGVAQLETYQDMLKIRRRNARHLGAGIEYLNNHWGDIFIPAPKEPWNGHAYMMYPILLNKRNGETISKKPLTDFLNDHGIETRDMPPLLGQPGNPYCDLKREDYPVSDWVERSGFYVGCHQDLTPKHIQHVLSCLELWVEG